MIQIDGTNESIQATAGTAGTLDVHTSWTDHAAGVFTPDSKETPITGTSALDIVVAPAASTQRRIGYISVVNRHATITTTIKITKLVAAAVTELVHDTVILLPGWAIVYAKGIWYVYDAKFAVLTGPTAGRFLRRTLLTSGTTFNTGVDTETILIRGVGGGAGGAGCTSVGSAAAAGGGGGSGAYVEKLFDVLPNTGYAYTIGAAGNGVSGAAGANGGSSTFTGPGAVVVTAPGGTGAPVATAATTLTARAGGAGGVIPTNGDVNLPGIPGESGHTLIVATPIVRSGAGGASPLGGGGGIGLVAVGNGSAAPAGSWGAGGGGAATGASAVRTGGNGVGGCWVVEEYT